MMSDLDVQALSYAPLLYMADQKIGSAKGRGIYLLEKTPASNLHIPSHDYSGGL